MACPRCGAGEGQHLGYKTCMEVLQRRVERQSRSISEYRAEAEATREVPKRAMSPVGMESPVGMDVRDYFAGQAPAGILASSPSDKPVPDEYMTAGQAYRFADAMMHGRDRKPDPSPPGGSEE
jgi:hypothetical protein